MFKLNLKNTLLGTLGAFSRWFSFSQVGPMYPFPGGYPSNMAKPYGHAAIPPVQQSRCGEDQLPGRENPQKVIAKVVSKMPNPIIQ